MDDVKISADSRLNTIIENGVKLGHRSLIVVLGSNNAEQVMVMHHLMSKVSKERPSVLWCHKRGSDVPRQSRKQLKKLEKNLKSGKCDISKENAFHIFLLATPIKYCSYSDSKEVLGSTYGMCVLQDIEGLTPNVLCRVVETVKGGGLIAVLTKESSLKQLFDLQMDVHQKLKTHSHPHIVPLFNERLVISLGWCKSCLILDDKMQVMKELDSLSGPVHPVSSILLEKQKESCNKLADLQENLSDADKPLPQLVGCCRTVDQAKAVLKMMDVLTEKVGRGTVSITAGRGRGKSSALGLGVAAAIHFGLNNIFVTSPTPDNLATFFEFIFKGFDALDYKEQEDYEIIQSTNVDFNQAIVRINVFREYRQTIQYMDPTDAKKLSQAELLVIDEAAAIPLPYVKALLGTYNVFMASTINGYEGTGRSLSLKLLNQLRQQGGGSKDIVNMPESSLSSNQPLHEISLKESIRYSEGDPVEKWLNDMLCLYATSSQTHSSTCPPPHSCQLYYINRDVLMSGHEESEDFLQQVMSLLVASHYRNSPDDLQILADAPAHHLFVLLSPILPGMTSLPTVLAVIQVCMEGNISKKVSDECKIRGDRPSGDLVPWSLALQFLDTSLTEYVGVRVVRVATHPDYQSMGYGSRAINLLNDYYRGKHITLEDEQDSIVNNIPVQHKDDVIEPRRRDKPLLLKLGERIPESIDYLSVSYGVTPQLFKFWRKVGFIPLYISQVANKVTGEHNCIMVNPLDEEETTSDRLLPLSSDSSCSWIKKPSADFVHRFITLLNGSLNNLPPLLALSIIQTHDKYIKEKEIEWNELKLMITGHDLNRIERFAKNLADRNLISDIFPSLALLYFTKRLPSVQLSLLQAGILVGLGLQAKTVDEMVKSMDLPVESLLGQLGRAIKRFLKVLSSIQEGSLSRHLPSNTATLADFTPVDITLDQDLEKAAQDYEVDTQQNIESYNPNIRQLGNLTKFAIQGDEATWKAALESGGDKGKITIANTKLPSRLSEKQLEQELSGPPAKKPKRGGSHKRKKNIE